MQTKEQYVVKRTIAWDVRRAVSAQIASQAVGSIEPGCNIFGVNKGKFSLVDIITHVLEQTGPADVVLSTWTAANADMAFAYKLMTDGAIKSLRMIVDFSFPTRQAPYCAAMRERFGDDAIRVTKTHAKFVTIRNDKWNIVIRSSMNLNENRRLETFEISDSLPMAEFLEQLIAELFSTQAAGQGFTDTPYSNCVKFESLFEEHAEAPLQLPSSTDSNKYFGNGRYDNDIRRSGRAVA